MTLQDTGTRPATPTTPATATGSTAAAHAAWRAAREDDLRTPHGWLSLVAYLDVPHTPTPLGAVPGRWWVDGGRVHHAVGADVTTHDVDEAGSQVVTTYLPSGRRPAAPGAETAEVAVELVRRTGRHALRLRDPQAAARTSFTGVPVFAHDASWVLDAPVRWHAEPRQVVVGAARPGLVHRTTVVGEVDVTREGRTATLALTGGPGGAVALLFSDEAADVAPWRVLQVGTPDAGATTVRLDLNRAVNLPYAFSDHGTCPAPVPGNHLPFAVTAGERVPR